MGEALEAQGVPDPGKPYRVTTRVGEWTTDDFADGPEITGRWEVTPMLAGPGTYHAQFVYRSGWYGVRIHEVSLMSATRDDPDAVTPVAVDGREGSAGYLRTVIYDLTLAEHDPDLSYFLVARMLGMPRERPPDRQGCEGDVYFWKSRAR